MQKSTIKLGGFLGKKYGKTFKLFAKTPADAIAILAANFKTFQADFVKHSYTVTVNKEAISEDEVGNRSAGKCITFNPVLGGRGNGTRVVAGIVLVIVGAYMNAVTPGSGATVMQFGWGLIIGGVIGMMFGVNPSADAESNDSGKTSYLFGGTINTVGSGNPVPILYGEAMVGSQVISAGKTTEPINVIL